MCSVRSRTTSAETFGDDLLDVEGETRGKVGSRDKSLQQRGLLGGDRPERRQEGGELNAFGLTRREQRLDEAMVQDRFGGVRFQRGAVAAARRRRRSASGV